MGETSLPKDEGPYILLWYQIGHVTHVGICFHGRLVEYSANGLEMTTGGKFHPFVKESLGKTGKTWSEFVTWYGIQEKGPFKKANFDIVNNNCIVFAKKMAEFLKVPFSKTAQEQLDWVGKNPGLTRLGGFLGSSSSSSRVSS